MGGDVTHSLSYRHTRSLKANLGIRELQKQNDKYLKDLEAKRLLELKRQEEAEAKLRDEELRRKESAKINTDEKKKRRKKKKKIQVRLSSHSLTHSLTRSLSLCV